MTKIAANSMKCASASGCAHTGVVYLAQPKADPVEAEHQTPPAAPPGADKTKTENE